MIEKKPQTPLRQGDTYVYPLTYADQVILADGEGRLMKNGKIYADHAVEAETALEATYVLHSDPRDAADENPVLEGITINTEGTGGTGVPDGGTAGQILIKQTSTDGDVEWTDPTIADIYPDPDEEDTTEESVVLPVSADLLGGKEPMYYIQPRNLLDNSWWGGALVDGVKKDLVNQRGVGAETSNNTGYVIDRWAIWHSNGNTHFYLEDGCIKVWAESTGTGSFSQRFEKNMLSSAKKYTFAYQTFAGDIVVDNDPVTYGTEYDHIGITLAANQTVKVVWAALYEGEYTADNLPPYVAKGYGAELAECMRYYIDFGNSPIRFSSLTSAIVANIQFPVVMRKTPNITQTYLYGTTYATEGVNPSKFGVSWELVDSDYRVINNVVANAEL